MRPEVTSSSRVADQIYGTPGASQIALPVHLSTVAAGMTKGLDLPWACPTRRAVDGACRCDYGCPLTGCRIVICVHMVDTSSRQAGEGLSDGEFAVVAAEHSCSALRRGQRKGQDPVQEGVPSELRDPWQRRQTTTSGPPPTQSSRWR